MVVKMRQEEASVYSHQLDLCNIIKLIETAKILKKSEKSDLKMQLKGSNLKNFLTPRKGPGPYKQLYVKVGGYNLSKQIKLSN